MPYRKSNSPTAIILRNYSNNPDFRTSLVEEIAFQNIRTGSATLSVDELLAVLSIWLSQKPLHEVFSLISLHRSDGWIDLFDSRFFERFSNTVATWRYKGVNDVADNLLKVGKYIAEMTQNISYVKKYEKEIFRRQREKDRIHLTHLGPNP